MQDTICDACTPRVLVLPKTKQPIKSCDYCESCDSACGAVLSGCDSAVAILGMRERIKQASKSFLFVRSPDLEAIPGKKSAGRTDKGINDIEP